MILSGGMLLKVLCSMPYSPEKQRAFLHVRKRLLAAHLAGKVRGSGGEVVLSAIARTVLRGLAAAEVDAVSLDADVPMEALAPERLRGLWLACDAEPPLSHPIWIFFIDKGGFGLLEEDQSANLGLWRGGAPDRAADPPFGFFRF